MTRRADQFLLSTLIAALLSAAAPTIAGSVDGIRPAVASPVAPRGGVMMLPLVAQRPGDDWPRTMEVRLADDRRVTADVVWISVRKDQQGFTSWTSDPRRLTLRSIERTDDTSATFDAAAGEGPYLIVRLPDDGDGPLKVEGRTLTPVWRDVPWTDPLADAAPAPDRALPLEQAPDRPDVESPFEYWRWVLLADRLGLNPPAPAGDDVQKLAAEHYAVLWRMGLARLNGISPRIARECRSMLTRTALDRNRTAATWIVDPAQIASLLATLIDFTRSDQQALAAAVAWLEQQPLFTLWPEDESGGDVRLAITSLRDDAIPVTLAWLGSSQPASELQLEPGIIAHITVSRMPMQPAPIGSGQREMEPPMQTLRVESGVGGASTSLDIPCGSRVIEARPPGITFRPLSPPMSLADAQFNRAPAIQPERATLAHVRRIGARWEVFFEGGRILEKQQTLDRSAIREFDDLRGIEAVTILLGRDENDPSAIWLTIPEHDWPALIRGQNHPDLQVHKRSFADRWNCRIVLPDAWFSAAETNPAFIAFIRTHGDTNDLETGPAPSPAWRISTGRIAIDLSHWDDLPTVDQ